MYRQERGFDDAFSIGWPEVDAMAEIRQYRTEIALNDTFQKHNVNDSMEIEELVSKTIESLTEKFKFAPTTEFVFDRLSNFNVRQGHLAQDPENRTKITRGGFFTSS
mmetsp:Transcript_1847/g.2420  ORF Transcript_1847/g.2420 Transcript_1847/m.2420 type:complete len:107 (+) Transcript_1847:31-351(+)